MRNVYRRILEAFVCVVYICSLGWRPASAFRAPCVPVTLAAASVLQTRPSLHGAVIHRIPAVYQTAVDVEEVSQTGEVASEGGDIAGVSNAVAEEPKPPFEDLELCDEIRDSFMKYALSIILGRALPDARDGLKVVHRRILWAMQELKLGASTAYRKCAKVVGDVLGRYHPHSDKSVYDALCRLSQRFMMRVPLVDGHGNFGSADDPPAAMRYTECRLSAFSENLLLADVGRDTVDMLPNFDSTELEPTVLPSKVPMLLINGSSGIAVGLATSIPPHNPDEIISAAALMARNHGDVDPEVLMHIVRGPDFPTGGHISTTMENMRKIYTTGKGSIMLQAKYSYEERIKPRNSKRESDIVVNTYNKLSHLTFSAGSRVSIIVNELPYNVRVTQRDVLMSISKAVETGSLRGISDLRDESDRSGIRLVIDLKKHVTTHMEVEEIMNKLKRMSGLCSFFKCNFVALDSSGTKPVRLSLYSALRIWLDFRVQTVRRRTMHFLRDAKERLHMVKGLIIASNHIEEIIRMIRASPSPADARKALADKRYGGLKGDQASAVLRMTLSQLSKMEREKFEKEEAALKETIDRYNKLLNDERSIYAFISSELEDIQQQRRKHYNLKRRSTTLSVAGRPKINLADLLKDASAPQDTSTCMESVLDGEDDGATSDAGSDSDSQYDEEYDYNGDGESEAEDEKSYNKDPSLLVLNDLGWMQRIKFDNMFFTSGRSRSIYSPRVYQAQVAQYSVNSENTEPEQSPDPIHEKVTLNYATCKPGDMALLIGTDGMCVTFPVSKLRICSRGYSMWKALDVERTEKIAHFMVTSKLRSANAEDGEHSEKKKLLLEDPEGFLIVGFADGEVSVMRSSILEGIRLNKFGVGKMRLWKDERPDPVFALLAGSKDDIILGTSQGYVLRVHVETLLRGLDNRVRTRRKVIRLKENDAVTCGALLEYSAAESSPEDAVISDEQPSDADVNDQPENNNTDDSPSPALKPTEETSPTGRHLMMLSRSGKGKLIPVGEVKVNRHCGLGYDIMRNSKSAIDSLVAIVPVEPEDHVLLVSERGILARKDPFALRPGLRHHKTRNFWSRIHGTDVVKYAAKI
ncbi:DNA gyrase subunit A [Babesia ovata]|uniref:DNA topoisomerase (ATP-hydrolyzing) n=1 Tax=Babesia ovata TaxID=189622 RepID=A0A2H6KDX6_9APIC|nr:DNA gyrase subunit A [Babesia ovata]GBE61159.1 DNA gyrase subunit A [Babesia ovata]